MTYQMVYVGPGQDEGLDGGVTVEQEVEEQGGLVLLKGGAQRAVQSRKVDLKGGHRLGRTRVGCRVWKIFKVHFSSQRIF